MSQKPLRKIFILSSLLCTLILPAAGQIMISGIISDSAGRAVPFPQVVLKSPSGEKTIDFTQADAQGKYKIGLPNPGKFILEFHAMSFKTVSEPISINSDSLETDIEKNIILTPLAMEIHEVLVIRELPVREKKDTIIFNAASFLQGNEEVAEDLLRKLPGVNVDDGGTIRIQGREIEKIMIEGDDLFEKGYKIVSRNLHVGVIDKVELLMKYSGQPLLKDFENSEKVALNLTLREDAKVKVFGNIESGWSTNNLHQARINLMSFKKKLKLYFFSQSNNLGEDVLGDVESLINPAQSTTDYTPVSLTEPAFYINLKSSRPDLRDSRIKFNNDKMASPNAIYSPNSRVKLKAVSFIASEEENYFRDSYRSYRTGEDIYTHTESYRMQDQFKNIYLKLDGNITPDSSSQLDYKGIYNMNNGHARSMLIFNQQPSNEWLKNEFQTTDQVLTYINKHRNGKAFIITGRILTDARSEIFTVKDHLYPDHFPEIGGIHKLEQRNNASLLFSGVEASYLIRSRKNTTLQIRSGYAFNRNRLETALLITDTSNIKHPAGSDFNNSLVFNSSDIYAGISGDKLMGKFLFSGSLELHQPGYRKDYEGEHSGKTGLPAYLRPKISGKWDINRKQSLQGTYVYNSVTSSAEDLLFGKMLTSYHTFQGGTGSYEIMRGHMAFFVFNHGTWMAKKHFNASLLYLKNRDYLMPVTDVSTEYIFSGKMLGKNRQTIALSTTADFFLRPLLNNLKFNLQVSDMRYNQILNESLYHVNWRVLNAGPEFKSVFGGFFNYHVGSRFTFAIIESGARNERFENFQFIDFIWQIAKPVYLMTRFERYHFPHIQLDKKSWYFVDAALNWNLKPNKWKISLDINNLLNLNEFGAQTISESETSSVFYRLVPGYVLLKVGFRI